MKPAARQFPAAARAALADAPLQAALGTFRTGFPARRAAAVAQLPEFEALREEGRRIKDHALAHLDLYLERFEAQVVAAGGHVHWCGTAEEARAVITALCREAGAGLIAKGKSMVAEEIALNDALLAAGMTPVETDLGEYIIQLRGETPSHIVAPALHLSKEQVADTFRAEHAQLPPDRDLGPAPALVAEARRVLRETFLAARVGITGANFLIAETGSAVIVTNEGNGDLSQTLPGTHIVLAGIEKIVPTLEDAATLIRLLPRSATGQEISSYVTLGTGPRRADDADGPHAFHVVLLDNGRSGLLGTPLQEALRCIRCGACMNHCPVYGAIGGHAYGWVYPGPIGAVLDPALIGLEEAHHLPNASTFCGRCEAVCPVKIPLPSLMRHWREEQFRRRQAPRALRWGLGLWAALARRPRLYGWGARLAMAVLKRLGGPDGRIASLPPAEGWTAVRDLPAPQGGTFQAQWAQAQRAQAHRAARKGRT